jgi:hypothetical protein
MFSCESEIGPKAGVVDWGWGRTSAGSGTLRYLHGYSLGTRALGQSLNLAHVKLK